MRPRARQTYCGNVPTGAMKCVGLPTNSRIIDDHRERQHANSRSPQWRSLANFCYLDSRWIWYSALVCNWSHTIADRASLVNELVVQ